MKLSIEDFIKTQKTWTKYDYYWEDDNGEKVIVPKEDLAKFLDEILAYDDLDADSIIHYKKENAWIMAMANQIDNDYISMGLNIMSGYWIIDMQILYEALDEGVWDYEEC